MQKSMVNTENQPNNCTMDSNYSLAYQEAKNNVVYFEHSLLKIATMKGSDSLDFLNRISTNEVHNLKHNESIQTILTSDKGRIIDVVTLLRKDNNEIVVISSNDSLDSTIRWMKKYIIMDEVSVKENTQYTAIELHGPRSITFVREFFSLEDFDSSIQKFTIHQDSGTVIARIPAMSEISMLLLIPKENENVLSLITSTLKQLSEIDRELLRIEAGMGKSPNELNEKYNPLEAGMLHIINFKKGCYIGQEVIARLDSYNKVKLRLFGIQSSKEIHLDEKIFVNNSEIGIITSILKFTNEITIGLCYVRGEFAHDNSTIEVRSNDGSVKSALLKKLPFSNE